MIDDTLNVRLYKRMLQMIADYRTNNLGLRQLISNLEGLCKLLENNSENFETIFYQLWMPLEEVFAVALESSNGTLDENDHILINHSLTKLDELINIELTRY